MSGLDLVLLLIACAVGLFSVLGKVETRQDMKAQTYLIVIFLPFAIATFGYLVMWAGTLLAESARPGATSGSTAALLAAIPGALTGLVAGAFAMSVVAAIVMRRRNAGRDLPVAEASS